MDKKQKLTKRPGRRGGDDLKWEKTFGDDTEDLEDDIEDLGEDIEYLGNDAENLGHNIEDFIEDFKDDITDLEDGLEEDLEEWKENLEDEEDMDSVPFKAFMIFGALTVLAALICVLLWTATHRDKNADNLSGMAGTPDTDVSETLAEEGKSSTDSITEESQTPENPQDSVPPQEAMKPQDSMEPQTPEKPQDSMNPQTSAKPQDSQAAGSMPGITEQKPEPSAGSTDGAGGQAAGTAGSSSEPSDGEIVSGDTTMTFRAVSESVTAKDVTNLRSAPSTADTENVVSQLVNGASLTRTGINEDTGWSRLDYQGQTVYAVSQYLTTDLNYKTPVAQVNPNRVSTKDGRVIIFVDLDDTVTPKEFVNLRIEPSTTEGDSTVRCQVKNGESVHRTGYSHDSGWSRVEYNGEVLYVVSSMVYNVEGQ